MESGQDLPLNQLRSISHNKLYVLVTKAFTTRGNKYELGNCFIVPTISYCIRNSSNLERLGEEEADLRCWQFLCRL